MRISDWSSDVCSSDLRPSPAARVEKPKDSPSPAVRQNDRNKSAKRMAKTATATAETTPTPAESNDSPLLDTLNAEIKKMIDRGKERSEERRVGKECVSTCQSRWWTYH